jgi:hypothetical protein
VTKKISNVPVFLIYAGIIHAIGLALLMPMLITLPGPGTAIAPQPTAIDVEIIPGTQVQAKTEADGEQTAALPAASSDGEGTPVEVDGEAVANIGPAMPAAEAEGRLQQEEPAEADTPAETVKPEGNDKAAAPANATPRAAKKPVAQPSRTVKPAVRRPAKGQAKIAPFNGALSGLFSPGAPANSRRR